MSISHVYSLTWTATDEAVVDHLNLIVLFAPISSGLVKGPLHKVLYTPLWDCEQHLASEASEDTLFGKFF